MYGQVDALNSMQSHSTDAMQARQHIVQKDPAEIECHEGNNLGESNLDAMMAGRPASRHHRSACVSACAEALHVVPALRLVAGHFQRDPLARHVIDEIDGDLDIVGEEET